MSAQLFNEEGDAVEAFTQEEVEEKITEKVTEEVEKAVEQLNKERQEEIDKLYTDLEAKEKEKTELENKLKGVDNKTLNFKNLRTQVEKKDDVITSLQETIKEMEKNLNLKIEGITSETQKQKISNLISEITKGDKELAAKVEVYYNKFANQPANEEELKQRLNDSLLLALGGKQPSFLSGGAISSTAGTEIQKKEEKLSEGALDVGKKMGITEQELKKHKLI